MGEELGDVVTREEIRESDKGRVVKDGEGSGKWEGELGIRSLSVPH